MPLWHCIWMPYWFLMGNCVSDQDGWDFLVEKAKTGSFVHFPDYSKLTQRDEITSLSLAPHPSGYRPLSSAFDSIKRGQGKIRLFPPSCCFSLPLLSPYLLAFSFHSPLRSSGIDPCQLLHRPYYFISSYLSSHILILFLVGASENVLLLNVNILKHAMQPVIPNHKICKRKTDYWNQSLVDNWKSVFPLPLTFFLIRKK